MSFSDISQYPEDVPNGTPSAAAAAWHAKAYAFLRHRAKGQLGPVLRAKYDETDIAGNAYVKMVPKLPDIRPDSVRGWVYSFLHYEILDLARYTKTRREVAGDGISRLEAAGPRPEEVASTNDQIDRVRSAVAGMSAEDREIIDLRQTRGMKFSEIGEALGITLAAASGRYYPAKERLRQAIGEVE